MAAASDTLNRKEAAAYLRSLGYNISAKTLANMASNGNRGKGPAFTQYRWRTVSYRRFDLEEWAKRESRRVE
jgi:hypothetical protein